GSFERLRLHLPPIAGVRPIAPAAAFGSNTVLIDASRSQEQVQRMPLLPGDKVWISVRRIHALVHPGLSFVILSDGSPAAKVTLAAAGQIARLAHARTTILGIMPAGVERERFQAELRDQVGSGLPSLEARTAQGAPAELLQAELERRPHDLVVLSDRPGIEDIAAQLLQTGEHHLLLMPASQQVPERVRVCVAAGEPGKDDVRFAGRLIRHLEAGVTLMTVLPPGSSATTRQRAERFLEAGVRTLELLGLQAETVIRHGSVRQEIDRELRENQHDMLVLGVPLPSPAWHDVLPGVVGQIVGEHQNRPVLLVRSREAIVRATRVSGPARIRVDEEVLR
ncbi:MAG TPA: universal stress protein, partial [Roseiflexaceae bacterium]|nr:universal stress protein [Roseiflexaceae bacterium]